MKSSQKWLLGALLGGILIVIAIIYNNNQKTDWSVNFNWDTEKPHDFKFFKEIISKNRKKAEVATVEKDLTNALSSIEGSGNVYLQMGYHQQHSDEEAEALLQFMQAGNTVFIATPATPSVLLQYIYLPKDSIAAIKEVLFSKTDEFEADSLFDASTFEAQQDSATIWYAETIKEELRRDFNKTQTLNDTLITLTLESGTALDLYQKSNFGKEEHNWNFYYDSTESRILEDAKVLGRINKKHPFFIEIPVGNGKIQMLMEPLIFTNYHIQREEGFTFISEITEGWALESNKKIFIDNINRRQFNRKNNNFYDSPLTFILAQRELRWAWYLLLLLVFTYVSANLRRRQREIPVTPKVKNTALEFAKALGTLDQIQLSPAEEAQEIMQLFKGEVFEKLRLPYVDPPKVYLSTIVKLRPEIKTTIERAFALYHTAIHNPTNFNKESLTEFFNLLNQAERAL